MLRSLHDFPEDGIVSVSQDYDPKALDLEFFDYKYAEGLHLGGEVQKTEETLHFWGQLNSRIEHICGRCLEAVMEPLDQPFDLYYEVKGRESVDATEDLREILILAYPIRFYCRPECKGLCPKCGTNRNEKMCRCDVSHETSEPLSRLGQFWHSKKQKE